MTEIMKSGSRLRSVRKASSDINWLLIPGGPGIESDYMVSMAMQTQLEINLLTFDLPRAEHYRSGPQYSDVVKWWKEDLQEAVQYRQNMVVVGHSFGGMLALSTSEIEKCCAGAIFLDSSPSRDWEKHSALAMKKIDATDAKMAEEAFARNPSDEEFKKLCVAWAPFYFLPQFEAEGRDVLFSTKYNYFPYQACGEFFKNFGSTWSDWTFPTLCLAGEQDLITPLSLFKNSPTFANQSNVEFEEVKNAGHFPWVENSRQFFSIIQDFHRRSYS